MAVRFPADPLMQNEIVSACSMTANSSVAQHERSFSASVSSAVRKPSCALKRNAAPPGRRSAIPPKVCTNAAISPMRWPNAPGSNEQ